MLFPRLYDWYCVQYPDIVFAISAERIKLLLNYSSRMTISFD